MAKRKTKYYVVWQGLAPGVYETWETCKAQVHGQKGAKYKSFPTREEAEQAFKNGPEAYWGIASLQSEIHKTSASATGQPIRESLAVDAACSGNPGNMEYRGVYTATGQEIFHPHARLPCFVIKKGFSHFFGAVNLRICHFPRPCIVFPLSRAALMF